MGWLDELAAPVIWTWRATDQSRAEYPRWTIALLAR
jgi:hypothetical protein